MENKLQEMTLSQELVWRGMVNQTTIKDIGSLDNQTQTFYKGFDASAPSQTIGNLAAMMVDLVFLRHGYKGIILAGGSTSLIGDPGGKDSERPMQSIETINENVSRAEKQLRHIYRQHEVTFVNNLDWTKNISVLDFLRDTGKYFNVGEMIKKDYISTRLGVDGAGISYTEFSYSLLQGFDFLHLYQKYGCTLQIGGSDQWSNCLAGVELIRRKLGKEVNVMTLPLIIDNITGKKFGKSEAGAVWLDPEMTSPYEFYQFWLNVDDEGAKNYLKFYTNISKVDHDELIAEFDKDRSNRMAQKYLAYSLTELVHGKESAEQSKTTSESLFGQKIDINSADIETYNIKPEYIIDDKFQMVEFLVGENILKSKREAREIIEAGGVYIDDVSVKEENIAITTLTKEFLLRIGKKRYFKIKL